MRVLSVVFLTLLALLGAAVAVATSGAYNVAATQTEGAVTEWALETVAHRSIARHARDIGAMPELDSAALVGGLDHFHGMCVDCHGAPGFDRTEAGQGLNPPAPDLDEVVAEGEWSDAELFWIVKNGIKMTGMPAFGPTHGDEDLWAIVAIMKELPDLSEEAYAERVEALSAPAPAEGGEAPAEEEGHTHADGRQHVR
ncbi:MAG: cytochrome c [Gemmatimonadota bacterium]